MTKLTSQRLTFHMSSCKVYSIYKVATYKKQQHGPRSKITMHEHLHRCLAEVLTIRVASL